jgi:Fe-S cluster biogenesis protein NfuA
MVTREQAEYAIARLRPSLQAQGGDIHLVDGGTDVTPGVRLSGSCIGCSTGTMTLYDGLQAALLFGIRNLNRKRPC